MDDNNDFRLISMDDSIDFRLRAATTPVTIYWLSEVFRMSPETVRKRLATCEVASYKGTSKRYYVHVAAEFLIKPRDDIEEYIKRMKPHELPASLQKEIWDARLKQQRWELAAGDLWHTSDIIAVLSDVFSAIKASILLWPDMVERAVGLTEAQRELLVRLGDTLQDDVYKKLHKAMMDKNTRASIIDFDDTDDKEEESLEDLL